MVFGFSLASLELNNLLNIFGILPLRECIAILKYFGLKAISVISYLVNLQKIKTGVLLAFWHLIPSTANKLCFGFVFIFIVIFIYVCLRGLNQIKQKPQIAKMAANTKRKINETRVHRNLPKCFGIWHMANPMLMAL